MIEGLDAILSDFHIQTQHPELYEMAFTHRSYTNEHPECPCYDRLEFRYGSRTSCLRSFPER